MNYIKEANSFYKEGCNELKKAIKLKDKIILRDACEKLWGAVIEATNELFIKKGIKDLPKSHRDRRLLLIHLSKIHKDVDELYIVDRFMARDDALHMRGFYNGNIDVEELKVEIEKVKKYIEDVEKIKEV